MNGFGAVACLPANTNITMLRSAQKFIAILLMLWLPLVSGNAFALAMVMSVNDIQSQAMAEQDCPEHADMHKAADGKCSQCEFCQIACAAYLPVPLLTVPAEAVLRPDFPPFIGSLHSLALPVEYPPPIFHA